MKERFEPIWENFNLIMYSVLGLQFFLIFSFYFLMKSSFGLLIMFFLIALINFAFMKDFLEEGTKKKGFIMFKASILLFGFNLINHIVYSVFYVALLKIAQKAGQALNLSAIYGLASVGNFLIILGFFYILKKESINEVFEDFYENSVWELLGLIKKEQEIGDVWLCSNIDTGRDVYLPYKDRFLHMLVLGPTGSGKTSQTIIPMINQDMQNRSCGITVIEPKGDLAETIYAMAQHYGRTAVYFNPTFEACPTFNPLFGKEEDVIESMVTTFKMLNPDSPQFFQDMNEQLLRNGLKVLKRLKGNKATLLDLNRLLSNAGGEGRKMVMAFAKANAPNESIAKENSDISNYFLGDYLNEKSKTYEHTSGVRSQIGKVVSNKFLRKVLNPEDGTSDIDFDRHLEEGGVITIATAQGKLKELGSFLGYFLILNFQSAVFKRAGDEDTRRPHFLYIDEFQVYSNPGFANMLTQGRSYRVASHLATQNRALIGMGSGRDGQDFIELVSTNARNVIIYPGGNAQDADYYSKQFGEIKEIKHQKGISRAKFNPLYGFQKISYPNESIRTSEEMVARYSASDIIYREFGEITYAIIQNNTLQEPGVGKIAFIPYDLNKKLKRMVAENNALMFFGYNPNLIRNIENEGFLEEGVVESNTGVDIETLIENYELMKKKEVFGNNHGAELNPNIITSLNGNNGTSSNNSNDFYETEIEASKHIDNSGEEITLSEIEIGEDSSTSSSGGAEVIEIDIDEFDDEIDEF